MTKLERPPNDHPIENEIIDHIYEVAVDPSRLEALMDRWETAIGPRRKAIGPTQSRLGDIAHWEGHFERASRIMDRFLGENDGRGPLARVERSAAFMVERNLQISEVNAAATRILGVRAGAHLDELALEDIEKGSLSIEIGRMFVANDSADRLLRLRSLENDRLIICSLRLISPDGGPPRVLAMTSELDWPKGYSAVLQEAFDLTEAEVAVLQALTEGHSLTRIAATRGRSVDTVRAQIKSVMGKTETRTQAELVRLTISTLELARPAANRAADETAAGASGVVPPLPIKVLFRPDGRRLEWVEFGAPAGRPVLVLPMAFGLIRWPRAAEQAAQERGLRIVVPLRAGFGRSTPLPRKAEYLKESAEDLEAICQHLAFAQLPILTMMGDNLLAFELAMRHPERVRAVIACAGVLPFDTHEQYERMHKWHRFVIAGARYTPALLPFMSKAGFALSQRIGPLGMGRAIYAGSEADLALLDDPEMAAVMVAGSEMHSIPGDHYAMTFARDLIAHQTRNWNDVIEPLSRRLPLHFIFGAQDPQCPPETVAEWRAAHQGVEFTSFDDAGQLVFFSKWRQILPVLDKFST